MSLVEALGNFRARHPYHPYRPYLNLCFFRTSASVGRDGKDGRDHMAQRFLILFSGLLNLCYFLTLVGRDGKDGRGHIVQSFPHIYILSSDLVA
jgi:hypothetical protein